jgi:hypothetical protein
VVDARQQTPARLGVEIALHRRIGWKIPALGSKYHVVFAT